MSKPLAPGPRDESATSAAVRDGDAAARCVWSLLYDVPEIIGSRAFRAEKAAPAILEAAVDVVRGERGLLLLFDRARELAVRAAHALPADLDPATPEARPIAEAVDAALRNDTPTAGVFAGRSTLTVPLHGLIRQRTSHAIPAERRSRPPRRLVKQLGALYLDRPATAPFTPADAERLEAFVELATHHLVLTRLYEVATVDPLTGVYVRPELEPNLSVEMTVATHTNAPLGVAMLDIDRYDQLANEIGRRAADVILEQVATRIRRDLRAEDLVFRYGAGKLLVLLPGAGEEGAAAAAARAVATAHGAGHADVTLSAGVSVFPHHADRQDELIKRADQALFLAESAGGNRVELWTRAIARHALRTDKLIGIITGDPGRDYRNVLLLLDAIAVVNSIRERRALLSTILDMLLELTRAERGVLFLPEGEGPARPVDSDVTRAVTITRTRRTGSSGPVASPEKIRLEIAVAQDARKRRISVDDFSEAIVRRVAETGLPITILHQVGEEDPELDAELRALGLQVVIAVPLMVGSHLAGVIYVDGRRSEREVGEADLIFFQALAREIGVALENARLYEDNVRARRKVEELNRKLARKVATQAHELEETREFLESVQVELKTKYDYGRIVGKSEKMQQVYRLLDRVTDTPVPVLIQGESGTGKELVAKAIHYNGPRKRKRFVSVNCAAISPTLLESELFGHVKGAFTGADRDKTGLFEQADHGTLFLDEVQDMSNAMQRELLRVLQEKELRKVGGKDLVKVDVRIIAATNRVLKEMVAAGSFREDLYYRLNVVTIQLPPLRDRIEDIPLLVERYLTELSEAQSRPTIRVTRRALRKLCRCHFTGNVRELHNVLERATIMIDGSVLDEDDLDVDVPRASPGVAPTTRAPAGDGILDSSMLYLPYKKASEAFKGAYVRQLLERNEGNVTRASQESGLVRSSLHKIMRKLDVDAKTIRRRRRG